MTRHCTRPLPFPRYGRFYPGAQGTPPTFQTVSVGNLGTGLFTALTPLLLADLMHGTGRYNLAQGAVATLRAVGVTTSGLAGEFVISRMGYQAMFAACGIVGLAALGLLWWAMPETSQIGRPDQSPPGDGQDPRNPARAADVAKPLPGGAQRRSGADRLRGGRELPQPC
jgi:hypothetical protein